MPIIYQRWITRQDLRANPDKTYVFGDNIIREGLGGQAASMRGEPNAFGVPTKRYPTMGRGAFFSDESEDDVKHVTAALAELNDRLTRGETVVVPSDGLGTGLSMLPEKAPLIYKVLYDFFRKWGKGKCPWQPPIS